MADTRCLEDHELLPLLDGGKTASETRVHLDACAACRRRLEQLRAEVQSLRRNSKDSLSPK